ncbi:hypothetical protein D9M71_186310 [compost metagenome]
MSGSLPLLGLEQIQMLAIPAAEPVSHQYGTDSEQAKPDYIALAERNDDARRQQRPERRTGIAADLKGRLRQPKAPTRGQAGNT